LAIPFAADETGSSPIEPKRDHALEPPYRINSPTEKSGPSLISTTLEFVVLSPGPTVPSPGRVRYPGLRRSAAAALALSLLLKNRARGALARREALAVLLERGRQDVHLPSARTPKVPSSGVSGSGGGSVCPASVVPARPGWPRKSLALGAQLRHPGTDVSVSPGALLGHQAPAESHELAE